MSTDKAGTDRASDSESDLEISMVTEVVEAVEDDMVSTEVATSQHSTILSNESQPMAGTRNGTEMMQSDLSQTQGTRNDTEMMQPDLSQTQESEQPNVEVFMEVIEEPPALEDTEKRTGNIPSSLAVLITDQGNGKEQENDTMMETTEYAINEVVGGDIQHSPGTCSREIPLAKVQSASVTLIDPAQRESIILYAEQNSIAQASRRFKVPSTTIKKWMTSPEDGSCMLTKSKFNSPGQGRKLSYTQETDDKIAAHIQDLLARGEKVSLQYVCNYAKTIIREENSNFIASTGWGQRFLVRHAIDLGMQKPQKKKSGSSPELGRGRPLSYSQTTDRAIADYVRGRLADGRQLSNSELRRYAKEVVCKENPSFTGSASWAQNFLLRHKIALQSFPSVPVSTPSTLPRLPLSCPSSSSFPLASMSPSLSDASLVAAEITRTSGPSGPIYSDASIGGMDNIIDDPMKTALTLLTGENIDLTVLSTSQVVALQNSLSELTSNSVSLVDLLSSNSSSGGNASSDSHAQERGGGREDEERGAALIAAGLESPSGNVYLNLGSVSEAFGSGLMGPAATQVNPTTQTPPQSSGSAAGHSLEVVAQGSRPLSYAKETDRVLADWVQAQQAEGKRVTFASLRSYAKHLISSENPNFSASVGWVTPFLLRHNLDLSINRKVRTSRKGTPRRMASQDSGAEDRNEDREEPEDSESLEASQVIIESPSGVPRVQQELESSSCGATAITTVTPEMLASAIATTFAEAVLAQQQHQHLKEQEKEEQQQQHQPQQQNQEQLVLQEELSELPPPPHSQDMLVGSQQVPSASGIDRATPVAKQTQTPTLSLRHSDEGKQDHDASHKLRKTPRNNNKARSRHTLAEKLEVVQLMKEYGMAAHYVCRMLGIANSTFAGWTKLVRQKGPELQALSTNKRRANMTGQGRPLSYSREKDEQIAQWVIEQRQRGVSISPSELSKHATYIISKENPSFTASSGWQQKFLLRHNLQLSNCWTQKPGTSPSSSQEEESVSSSLVQSPVVEDPRNIPTPVQTEEVMSNSELSSSSVMQHASYPRALDEKLVLWVKERQTSGECVTVQTLCNKAEQLICKEVPSFVATLGWAFRFLHHNIMMLDFKSYAGGMPTLLAENCRKRPSEETECAESDSALATSKYLHTPKRVRQQMDQSSPAAALIPVSLMADNAADASVSDTPAIVAATPTTTGSTATIPITDITVSPSTGNLCEALLALSSQTMTGDGEPALQQAMQNLQTVMQHALKQQQQQIQLQQQQQQHLHGTQTVIPMTVIPVSTPSGGSSTPGGSSSTGSMKLSSSGGGHNSGSGVTTYNNYFGKPAREFSPEEKEEVVRYANATTLLKAAIKYGVAAPTVWRWRVELKLNQPKYTAMQKKYIIKFAETNSLKEASHRYGISSKTIQNWRKALQSDGDPVPMSGVVSEDASHLGGDGEQILEAIPTVAKVTTGQNAEVVAYDSHNFQFIIDGGEVSDIGGRGEHDMGDHVPATPLRVDPIPLEVTSEVDIENVGMEYDVISSEGHAAKPRCTAREKAQILQYAIEHSVREASQKYGISPGTLYYWKKMSTTVSSGAEDVQAGNTPPMASAAGASLTLGCGMVSNSPLPALGASQEDPASVMSMYPGASSILDHIHLAGRDSGGGGGGDDGKEGAEEGSDGKIGADQYLSSASDIVSTSLSGDVSSNPLSGTDVNLLRAVSSLLNSTDGTSAADLSLPSRPQSVMRRNSSISGGISSPTDVLVTPLQVASEEVATSVDEDNEEDNALVVSDHCPISVPLDHTGVSESVESVVVVEVEPQSQDSALSTSPVAMGEKGILEVEEVEQSVRSEVGYETTRPGLSGNA